jgi:hypothetical protein
MAPTNFYSLSGWWRIDHDATWRERRRVATVAPSLSC